VEGKGTGGTEGGPVGEQKKLEGGPQGFNQGKRGKQVVQGKKRVLEGKGGTLGCRWGTEFREKECITGETPWGTAQKKEIMRKTQRHHGQGPKAPQGG